MLGDNIKKASVLVVEDNHLDMLVIKVLLEKYFNLYIVSNGEDALKAADEFEFDVVLLDINLGDHLMDGVKVMKKLREDEKTKDLKIYAVTAYAEKLLSQDPGKLTTTSVVRKIEYAGKIAGNIKLNQKQLKVSLNISEIDEASLLQLEDFLKQLIQKSEKV